MHPKEKQTAGLLAPGCCGGKVCVQGAGEGGTEWLSRAQGTSPRQLGSLGAGALLEVFTAPATPWVMSHVGMESGESEEHICSTPATAGEGPMKTRWPNPGQTA